MLRSCSSSVFFQNMIDTGAGGQHRHAVDERPGPRAVLAGGVVEDEVGGDELPAPWDTTVKITFHRNGTQSW